MKTDYDAVYIMASTSVNKPVDSPSQDLDDSFTGFDLTQIMNVSEIASCKSVDFSIDSHFTGIKTGRGDSVTLKDVSSRKFAKTLVDSSNVCDDDVDVEKSHDNHDSRFTGFKTGRGDSVTLKDVSSRKFAKTLVDSSNVCDDDVDVEKSHDNHDSRFTGFKTGRGDSVTLKDVSSRKFAKTLVDSSNVCDDDVDVEKSHDNHDSRFTGFKTGRGDSVTLKDVSSRKFAKTLVDSSNVCDDDVDVEKSHDNHDSRFTGFKTGRGDSVTLKDVSSRKFAKTLVDSSNVCDDDVDVEKSHDNHDSRFTGFKTGRGDSVTLKDVSSRKFAKTLVDSSNVCDDDVDVEKSHDNHDSRFTGFKTGRGDSVTLKDVSSRKFAKTLVDSSNVCDDDVDVEKSHDNHDSRFTGFKTGRGDSVTLKDVSSRKFAKTLVDSSNVCDDDVDVEKSHDNHDSRFTGFKTGRGDSVTLKDVSSRKFAKTLVDSSNVCDDDVDVEKSHDNHDSRFTGFKTGRGDSVTLKDVSSRKFAKTLVDSSNVCDDDVDVEKSHVNHDSRFTGFKTGRGDSVTLKDVSSRKFAKTLVDSSNVCDDDVDVEKSHDNHDSRFTGFKTGRGDSVTLKDVSSRKFAKTLVDSSNVCDDDVDVEKSHDNHDSRFTGFKTGRGDSVTLKDVSSRKFAKTLVDSSNVCDDDVDVEKSHDNHDSRFTGFKTGRGDSVTLKDVSSRKFAKTLVDSSNVCDDDVDVEKSHDNHDSRFTGFKTGRGDSVTLKDVSSRKFAKTLVDSSNVCDDDVDVEKSHDNHDPRFTGFKTGRGDSVTLKDVSSRKFAETLADPYVSGYDFVKIEKCCQSYDCNPHNLKDNLSLCAYSGEKQIGEVHDDFWEASYNYIDSFRGCFDTQFDLSLERSEGDTHMMEINVSLEVEREKARADQQNLIAHNESIQSPNQHVLSTSDTSLNATLYGLLWNIRKRYYGTEILNSTKNQSLLKWKLLLADNANNQKLSVSSTPLHLPKYLKLLNDTYNKWSLQTADKLYWLLDMKYIMDTKSESNLPISYKFHYFILIPDKFGCVGKQEIINSFLSCSKICPNLITRGWIENHYLQIMWKIGTIALLYSDLCTTLLCDYCAPIHVLNELHYRYDREIETCQRPALRKVIEQDDTPARRLILCVSRIDIFDQCVKKACLTDGWYQIAWHPDPMLTTLITSGKIRVGSKLVTAGAELIVTNPSSTNSKPKGKCSSGDEQIDEFKHLYGDDGVAVGMALKLHGNSTRPVSWCSRLGFTTKQPSSGAGLYPVPLCTLSSDGGICSSIRVVIQRRYSLQYMETLEVPEQNSNTSTLLTRANSGPDELSSKLRLNRRRIFRSERAEEAEVRLYEARRLRVIDRALDRLVINDPSKRRIQPTHEQLIALGNDGEALLQAILNAPDSMEAESNLTQVQRDAIQHYKESIIHDAIVENVPPRQITPLLRLRVSGIHPRDIAGGYSASITLWNPTDEMLSLLKEGEVVEFYRLQVSATRANDPFASPSTLPGFVKPIGVNIPSGFVLSLSGGRTTRILSLGHISNLKGIVSTDNISRVYHPRVKLSVSEAYQAFIQEDQSSTSSLNKGNREVDLCCLIIAIYHTPMHSNPSSKSYPPDVKQQLDHPRTIDTPFKYPSSDVDCVYAVDVNCKSETCLSVIKFWDGLQALHLMDIVQIGRVLCFTDLQLRHCQTINTTSKLNNQPSRTIPLITLHYTSASNVTVEKPIVRRSSRIASNNESDPTVVSCLQQVLKDFLSSKSGCEIDLQISNSPLNHSKSLTPASNTSHSTGVGLSSLLRGSVGRVQSTPVHTTIETAKISTSLENSSSILNITCPSPTESMLKQGLPLKEQNFTPIKRFVSTTTTDCEQFLNNNTPKTVTCSYTRTLPNRSASRTGLSRKTRVRSSIPGLKNSSITVSDKSISHEIKQSEIVDIAKSPTPDIIHSLLITEEPCFTPEPKAKRPRSSQRSNQCDNSLELCNNKEILECIQSPKDILNSSVEEKEIISSSDAFRLKTPSYNSEIFTNSQLTNDSFDNSDMSIADLVKTRQRRQSRSSQHITTTSPTQHSTPIISKHRLSLKRTSK
ncbi:unnamed protein product [Schistosoma rodhaini]|nr:unnamed protein product [Schistosoma rodhaini]